MADFARFRAVTGSTGSSLTDMPFTLESGGSDGAGFSIDLPGLDSSRAAILMFKVSGKDGSHLMMDNDPNPGTQSRVIDFVLDATFTKPRSWHEIVQGYQFSASDNKFLVHVAATPPGAKVTFSDVVLLYHAHTP